MKANVHRKSGHSSKIWLEHRWRVMWLCRHSSLPPRWPDNQKTYGTVWELNNHVFYQCFEAQSRTQQHAERLCPNVDKSKPIATLLLGQASDIVWGLYMAPNIGKRLSVWGHTWFCSTQSSPATRTWQVITMGRVTVHAALPTSKCILADAPVRSSEVFFKIN